MMKLPRRHFLHLAGGAAVLPAVSRIAWAQVLSVAAGAHRSSAIAAGGTPDILARLVGQWLSERLGQPFVIENRPGRWQYRHRSGRARAAGRLHAPPGLSGKRNQCDALRQAQFQFHPRYRTDRRHHPRAARHGGPSFSACQDGARVHRLCQGVIPARSTWRPAAPETRPHLTGELFKMMAGVDMVHVPYRGGGPALTDLLGRTGAGVFRPRWSRQSSTSGPASCARSR